MFLEAQRTCPYCVVMSDFAPVGDVLERCCHAVFCVESYHFTFFAEHFGMGMHKFQVPSRSL